MSSAVIGTLASVIDGILVRKDRSDRGGTPMSHGPRHSLTIKRLERLLRKSQLGRVNNKDSGEG